MFKEIATAEALFHLAGTKQTAQYILDPFQRASALLEIAKVDPAHELEKVKPLIARLIRLPIDIDHILHAMASIQVLSNPTEAIQTALKMQSDRRRLQALLTIARLEPSHNFTEAKRLIEELAQSDDLINFVDMLRSDLVESETLFNPAEAKRSVQCIQNECIKSLALSRIATAQALHSTADAMLTVHEIGTFTSSTLKKIAKIRSLQNFTEAIGIAQTIPDLKVKLGALLSIAKVVFRIGHGSIIDNTG